jgi:hypothetical protein
MKDKNKGGVTIYSAYKRGLDSDSSWLGSTSSGV